MINLHNYTFEFERAAELLSVAQEHYQQAKTRKLAAERLFAAGELNEDAMSDAEQMLVCWKTQVEQMSRVTADLRSKECN